MQEVQIDQLLQNRAARPLIEAPEPLGLPGIDAKTGHFEEFGTDAATYLLDGVGGGLKGNHERPPLLPVTRVKTSRSSVLQISTPARRASAVAAPKASV